MNPVKQRTIFIKEFRFILLVKDLQKQRSFYEEIFNWPIINDWGGGVLYDTGAAVFELIQDSQAEKPNAACRIALSVPDIWTLFEQVKDKITLVFPLRNNSWGDTSFRIQDPEGFTITLFTPTKKSD